ncbi:MAG: Xaa-Pro peptidase family protein [Planctomycetota bacterium]|nr:Xaa-Pro peptidase family protein [Planctomycetota bacterium]
MEVFQPLGLSPELCRQRQRRLSRVMQQYRLEAAILVDPRHVYYFTGYWCRPVFATAFLLTHEQEATLVVPAPVEHSVAADLVRVYESNKMGTLVDLPVAATIGAMGDRLRRFQRVGADTGLPPVPALSELVDLGIPLLEMRRSKDPDEISLLRRAIGAAEAAYAYAVQTLAVGVMELDLYAGLMAAAIRGAGEPIGDFGNDFQIGGMGGPPRDHAAEAGEVAILDLSVTVRGYRADLCRSFVVGGIATTAQRDAHSQVVETLDDIANRLGPGVSCRELDERARTLLKNENGWVFPHHLGHGIGLSAHEGPRLNPHWDDRLQVGDVITLEPGLYGPELRAGVRVEDDYLITRDGARKLSSFPRDLTPDEISTHAVARAF